MYHEWKDSGNFSSICYGHSNLVLPLALLLNLILLPRPEPWLMPLWCFGSSKWESVSLLCTSCWGQMPTNIENLVCCLLNKTQGQNYFRVCPLLFNNSFNQQPDCWLIPKEIGIWKELKQPFVIKYVHKETATEAKSGSYRLLEGKVQVWFTFALSIEAVKQEDKDMMW